MAAEKNFETRIKKWLQSQGVYPFNTPVQKMKVPPVGYYEKRFANKMTGSGLPDLHVVIKGKSLEFELKAPNGHASELQKHNIRQINASMCCGWVVYEDKCPNDGFEFYADYERLKELCRQAIQG